ncbi:tape measure protein [Allisonella histaminiformans]|uniref:tape measure protein n=1 Tax=Allisonella histaminiformans TaxID=209880 RepID=UPI002E774616|nr:tape measure protein [Allisonella histaminiformans]
MAGHNIEISLNAVDNASSVIKRVENNTESLMRSTQSLGKVKVDGNGFKDMADKAKRAGSEVKDTRNEVEDLQGTLNGLKNAVLGAFTFTAIKDFVGSCLDASASVELLKKGLSFQIGEEQTDKLIKNIQTIGEQSAYDSNDLMNMAKQWVNIGDSADSATQKMKTIVDVGSAYGLTREQIEGANLALTQMQMSGKIGQQDMMQLINAGIPAWQLLSESMGLPVAQLKEMSSKGELTQQAIDTLFQSMQTKCQGATANMNGTLSAAFSNLDEVVHNTMASVGDIISKAFNVQGVSSALSDFVGKFRQDLEYIKTLMQNMSFREAFEKEYGAIADVIELIGNLAAAYMIVRAAQLAVAAAQAIINALTGNWGNLVLTVIVAALLYAYQHIDQIKAGWQTCCEAVQNGCKSIESWFKNAGSTISNAWHSVVDGIVSTFASGVNKLKSIWQGIVDTVSHPVDAVVNVTKNVAEHVTGSGTATGRPSAFGGVFGMASGGLVGGRIPALANGGTLKHGTPAIVGEAGPEAVIPLRKEVLVQIGAGIASAYKQNQELSSSLSTRIGEGIANAYKQGLDGVRKGTEIDAKIKASADTKDLSALEKIMADADKKAKDIGDSLREFHEYEEKANEEAKKYAENGAATLEFKQKEAELEKKIADLQTKPKAPARNSSKKQGVVTPEDSAVKSTRLDNAKSELEELRAKYAKEKAEALANAKDVADNKVRIEQDAQNSILAIQKEAMQKAASYRRTVDQAKQAEDKANNSESLSGYVEIMNQKDEITNQSYASILAHENELSEQRQIMHDQMMLNASSWSDYMQTVMMQTAQTMQDTLAEGITNWIMQAKSLSEVFSNLAKTILQQLIQGALKKWISSLGIIRTLNDAADKAEAASAAAQTSAIMTKAAAQARLAAATMISAMPFTAYGAGAIVAGQMDIASTGASVLKKAKGGAIIGPGTSTSDSIPALLSNGEYVINADAAAQIGRTTLDALNSGRYPAFASGGCVGGVPGEIPQGRNLTLNISTLDAASFDDFLSRGAMDKIKQKLLDGTRDFTAEAGVW